MCCITTIYAQEDEQLAQAAENAYLSQNYALAADLYSQLIDSGVQDFEVYFNAGSAYYQGGELGQSLYYFLKAQELNPRSQTLNLNIARIRSERVDYLPDSSQLLDVLGNASITLVTLYELQTMTFILWTAWFALGSVYFVRAKFRARIRVLQWITGALLAIMLVFMTTRMFLARERPRGVVLTPVVQVMSGPDEDYLPLYRLFSAVEMRLIDRSGDWVRFYLSDGRQGWVPSEAISLVDG